MNPADVHGRRLAMVVWGKKPDGSDEVVVYAGTAEWTGKHLRMLGESGELLLHLEDAWLGRLKAVEPSLKDIMLEADFSFSVSIGLLPEGVDMAQYSKIGIKWPTDDAG